MDWSRVLLLAACVSSAHSTTSKALLEEVEIIQPTKAAATLPKDANITKQADNYRYWDGDEEEELGAPYRRPPPPPQPSYARELALSNLPRTYNNQQPQPRRTFYTSDSYDPDNTDYAAPPDYKSNSGGSPYIITEQRLAEIRKRLMYWYFQKDMDGSGHGDYQTDIHASSTQLHKNLNFQLPFFGFRFNYTRVSINGYLEFSDPPETFNFPLSFPNRNWPKENDPAFIGIFYSKCRIGKINDDDVDPRKPGLYFRLERDLWGRTDRFGVEFRERLTWDLREGMIGTREFTPKHAVIVTWKNVSFSGGIVEALSKTNTFQMVLATDEVMTYAIFNYAQITWTTHTEARGDTTLGEGGTPAFVGFNAGNGTRSYQYAPFSQTLTVRDLPQRGWGNGIPGRHIFRIDENILPGSCNKDIAASVLDLQFAPESGNMLGGTIVNITGPCFIIDNRPVDIRCQFDDNQVKGTVIDINRAICIQPYVQAEGYIKLEISINVREFNWKGKYFLETPATATRSITFKNNAVHESYPAEIPIEWFPYNLTSNTGAPVRLSLWGYREIKTKPELFYIDTLEDGLINRGAYTIIPASYKSRDNWDLLDLTFGFLQINLTQASKYNDLTVTPVIWSRPIPLGWYFAPQWERKYGKNWADKMCDTWTMNDRFLKNFANQLPPCPCTLEQANADKGRFLPDFDCDMYTNPDCYYHKGALHCVRTGIPSVDGSEQQCCYDKNHYLMLTYDQKWGSSPKRASNLGLLPWNEANKVPTLSQWFHDKTPYYLCCMWQSEQSVGCETLRFERRPSQDCVGYQGPNVATVFGDPHVVTFDGLEYTFNGKGEFVLIHASTTKLKFDVQARFEQVGDNKNGEVFATKLTAVAARDNSSAKIEVRLRPHYAQWRYRLDVFADGKRIYFDRSPYRVQHFRGVTVYQPPYVLNQSEIVMMFESGVGVEVVENKAFMAVRVYMPWDYINHTRGLLGNWSFEINDDLTLPDGQYAAVALNDFESLDKNFASKWILEDKTDPLKGERLFINENGRGAGYYTNKTFQPIWKKTPREILPPNRSYEAQNADDFCGDSYQCKYDYAVTLDRDMAYYTQYYYSAYTYIKKLFSDRVLSCGVLETPRFGRKSTFLFVPNTKVKFECDQGFILTGDTKRSCLPNGKWDIPQIGYTECLRFVEYDSQQLGRTSLIVFGFLLPILLLLICGGVHIWRRATKRGSDPFNLFGSSRGSKPSSIVYMKPPPNAPTVKEENFDRHPATREEMPLVTSQVPRTSPESLNSTERSTETAPTSLEYDNENDHDNDGKPPPYSKKKKRNYDGVYFTNEPLPGLPEVDFNDGVWDLDEADVLAGNTRYDPPVSIVQPPSYQTPEVDTYDTRYGPSSNVQYEPTPIEVHHTHYGQPHRQASVETDIF